jgi:hypothetical protein
LRLVAILLFQKFELIQGFNPFGDNLHTQFMR